MTASGIPEPRASLLTRGAEACALVGALVACGLLARYSPLPAGDPLHGTLSALPLAMTLWVVALRRLAQRGRRAAQGRGAMLDVVGGAGLAIAIMVRPHAAPAGSAPVVAAALLAMILLGVWARLPDLRRALGNRLPARPPAAFLLLPLAAYLALLPYSTARRAPDGDEPWYLLVAHSLAYDGDTDLANNYAGQDSRRYMERAIEPQPGDPRGPLGEVYSRHSVLLPLALAPAYRFAGKHGALAMMALMAAALAWFTLRLASHDFADRPGEALVAWAALAFLPPLLLYSHQLWVEVPAALLVMVAADRLRILARRQARGLDWLILGASLTLLIGLKLRFGLLAASLLLLAVVDLEKHRKRLGAIVAVGMILGLGTLGYNWLRFANPLRIHSWSELWLLGASASGTVRGILGLFFDLAFGLFAAAPIWAILVPGLVVAGRRHRRWLRHLAVLSVPYLLAVASRSEWYGGWSPAFRYPMVLLPWLALLLIPALRDRHRPGPRALLAALGVATVLLALLFTAVPGWTYNLANGRSHLVDQLSTQIGGDVARLFPSSTRPRLATWVWPPAAIATLLGLWFVPWHRVSWRRLPRRRLPRRRRGRPSAFATSTLGVAGLLIGIAAVPWLARGQPTRVIEAEAPWVEKTGGHLDPEPWMIARLRFDEAWALRPGEELRANVIVGGATVAVKVRGRFIRNWDSDLELQLWCGDHRLASWTYGAADHDVTGERTTDPLLWTAGAPLRLVVARPTHTEHQPPNVVNGVIVDRIELTWR